MKNILTYIFDLVFPKHCAGCGKEGVFLCPECLKKIELFETKTCPICEIKNETGSICQNCRKDHFLDGLYAAADYNQPIIRAAIKTFKFKFVEKLHIPLADLIIKSVGAEHLPLKNPLLISPFQRGSSSQRRGDFENKFDLIIPVPLYKKRLAWRGFNQSEMIASRLSEYFKIPINRDCLIRVKNTPPQSKTKNQEEREENIKGAFAIGTSLPPLIPPSGRGGILLIDDVCSTASTLDECARILKQAGAKMVWGCVVARGR